MITIYVKAKSKKEINERLANGEEVWGENFSIFGGGGLLALGAPGTDGAVIKVFEKYVGERKN